MSVIRCECNQRLRKEVWQMNAIIHSRTLNAYWLLIAGILLVFFAIGRAIFDRNYHPIELFYGVAFFVCAFNLVASFKNLRTQIILGRICMAAVMLWPLMVMYGNLEPTKLTTASEISWASFFLLGALAIPVAQIGELAVHFITVAFGLSSTHDLSMAMSITQYFVFETSRYIVWVCIQWWLLVPFVMRWLRRKFVEEK